MRAALIHFDNGQLYLQTGRQAARF